MIDQLAALRHATAAQSHATVGIRRKASRGDARMSRRRAAGGLRTFRGLNRMARLSMARVPTFSPLPIRRRGDELGLVLARLIPAPGVSPVRTERPRPPSGQQREARSRCRSAHDRGPCGALLRAQVTTTTTGWAAGIPRERGLATTHPDRAPRALPSSVLLRTRRIHLRSPIAQSKDLPPISPSTDGSRVS